MADANGNSAKDCLVRALDAVFDIRALAAGAYGILECEPSAENTADAYRLLRHVISQADAAVAQLNQAEASLIAQKGGAA